jgi:hypothetical protein
MPFDLPNIDTINLDRDSGSNSEGLALTVSHSSVHLSRLNIQIESRDVLSNMITKSVLCSIQLIITCSAVVKASVMQEVASSAYHELVSDAASLAAHVPSLAGQTPFFVYTIQFARNEHKL